MAIDKKAGDNSAKEKLPPLQFRNNPEVKARLDAYKAANPKDVVYFTRLVNENPERAVDTLLLKDMKSFENEMRLIKRQMPQAKAFYDSQPAEAKARIDADMQGVEPFFRDKEFVAAALRESDRQTRREFASPGNTPAAAPAKVAA